MIRRLPPLLGLAAAVCGAWSAASAADLSGECVTRRVTGPGGAYRWERVECQPQAGWGDFDRWGFERTLDVVEPLHGDRYGGWSRIAPDAARPSQTDTVRPTYRVAGRDAGGFLVWPGKLP